MIEFVMLIIGFGLLTVAFMAVAALLIAPNGHPKYVRAETQYYYKGKWRRGLKFPVHDHYPPNVLENVELLKEQFGENNVRIYVHED